MPVPTDPALLNATTPPRTNFDFATTTVEETGI